MYSSIILCFLMFVISVGAWLVQTCPGKQDDWCQNWDPYIFSYRLSAFGLMLSSEPSQYNTHCLSTGVGG